MKSSLAVGIIVVISIVLIASVYVILQWDSSDDKSDFDVTVGPLLWRIEGDNPSYLYGSIHITNEEILTIPDVVIEALDEVDYFYSEMRLDEETQNQIINYYMLTDSTLQELLPDDVENRLSNYLESKGLSITSLSQFKIWVVTSQIIYFEDLSLAYNPSLDIYLWNLAVEKGKNMGGIETLEEQVNIFDTLTVDQQAHLLNDTLVLLEEYKEQGQGIVHTILYAYLNGDLEVLNELLVYTEDELDEIMYSRIVTNRNYNMSQRISDLVNNNPDTQYFFTIGAGHFYGDDGLLTLLENQGFTITRVLFDECTSCDNDEVKIKDRCYYPYEP